MILLSIAVIIVIVWLKFEDGQKEGLKFYPEPLEESDESLVWIKSTDQQNLNSLIKRVDDFLSPYNDSTTKKNTFDCTYDAGAPEGKVCDVKLKELEPCTKINYYNYNRGTPCIFLTFGKVYGWLPDYYTNVEELPEKMPQDLKHHIISEKGQNPNADKTVWVSCDGENPADVENIGSIHYFPKRGFPGYFFPYKNQEGYLNPVIALWFLNPARGVLINVVCKVWAKNINHQEELTSMVKSSIHFAILID